MVCLHYWKFHCQLVCYTKNHVEGTFYRRRSKKDDKFSVMLDERKLHHLQRKGDTKIGMRARVLKYMLCLLIPVNLCQFI